MTDLNAWAEKPLTRAELAKFLEEVAQSVERDPGEWENTTLDRFLEAMSAWVVDMDGSFTNRGLPVPTTPTWQLFAQMVLAGLIYE